MALWGALWVLPTGAWAADGHSPSGDLAPRALHGTKSGAKVPLKPLRPADAAARRGVAGGPTADDVGLGAESVDLRALREAERELFLPAAPAPGSSWPSELPLDLPDDHRPTVIATGLPPSAPPVADAPADSNLSWLAHTHLEMPDLPVRWDERVLRYLQYFRDDPVGHATYANLFRHSGRWREMVRRVLRQRSLPEDLAFVSMIESGFDPTARSASGAIGLWQFMPETAKVYGLAFDRWLDQRMSPALATDAAATLLSDLHRRFGSWELALAGFNMGYVGLASILRRYNTNDFWSLSRTEGTLPWETTLYVPKIIAAAVVGHNLAAFGFGDIVVDPAVETDDVDAPPGTPLAVVAQAAGCTTREIEALNPELRASRTPPAPDGPASCVVRVPQGKGPGAIVALARSRRDAPSLEHYVVRFGESLEQIAASRHTTPQKLIDLNGISAGEAIRGGTVLLVPRVDPTTAPPTAPGNAKPNVVVPADVFIVPDRKRVFYRVLVGDTLRDVAHALSVTADDLCRWNDIDPGARLQEGMTLQAYVDPALDRSRVLLSTDEDVNVLPVGTGEFFAALEHDKNFRRVLVRAKAGDTIDSIGRRFDVSSRTMERVNRRSRSEVLRDGDTVVVYVPSGSPLATPSGITLVTASEPGSPRF